MTTIGLANFVPTSFITAVEEAGLTDLAEKLKMGEYTIAEVGTALAGHPVLLAEFGKYVQNWRDENGYAVDGHPDFQGC